MEYKLHRVAPNSNGWTRPSPGRLGADGVGAHVEAHGFGHEDWNFKYSFAVDGVMLGYTVAHPAAMLAVEKFGVILATYDREGWKAVGYYDGATFRKQTNPYPDTVIQKMAVDVFALADSNDLSPTYREKTLAEIELMVRQELMHSCWIIPKDKVFVFPAPVSISKRLFNPGTQRMVTSYNISAKLFTTITNSKHKPVDVDDDLEMEEGELKLRMHKSGERKPALVAEFKRRLKSFACVICQFDFEDRYGDIGKTGSSLLGVGSRG